MGDSLEKIYYAIRTRCYNEKHDHYKDYGGRGIKVCEEWLEPRVGKERFIKWALENGYKKGLSIDRVDHEGDYSPNNCRWVTQKQQCNNTRKNINIYYNGKTHTLAEWCDILHLNYSKTYARLYRSHWSVEKAFEVIDDPFHKMVLYKGEYKSLSCWCRLLNKNDGMVRKRLKLGWSIERALEEKSRRRKAW